MSPKEHSFHILKRLSTEPELSQRALAKELGISVGKTNYCLRALMEKGLVKAGNFRNSRNKPAYAYLLTPQGIEEKARLTLEFLRLKQAEYEALRREIELLRMEAETARVGPGQQSMPIAVEAANGAEEQPFVSGTASTHAARNATN